ncbi:hypothetical protein [Streptomonospora arabica]|uniref:Lipoprotein n=1 Tax=Streptomonospora arabica TaxID=412417 RepID=A0ABV9STT7_9ACTN
MRALLAFTVLALSVGCSAPEGPAVPAARIAPLSGPSPSPPAPDTDAPEWDRSASARMSAPLLETEPAPDSDGDPPAGPGDPFYRPPGLDPCEPNAYGFEDNDACLRQHGY